MEQLSDILGSVNQWLKFAEAKNGAVVATTGAALWGAVRLIMSGDAGRYLNAYLLVLVAFFLASFVVSLLSFLPKLYPLEPSKELSKANEENILYFGHLAMLSKERLLERYRVAVGLQDKEITKIHGMYAEQIIINSRIALNKFYMFTTSAKLLLCGVLTPVIAIPLLWLLNKNRRGSNANG